VPSVLGQTEERASELLAEAGLESSVEPGASEAPVGEVFEQDPKAGTEADEGSEVTIFVSTGPGVGTVPEVAGLTVQEAQRKLRRRGFSTFDTRQDFSEVVEPGLVIRSVPPAGTTASRGETVTLIVSKGLDLVTVPTVVGLDEAEAEAELEDAGLIADVNPEDSDQPEGLVLSQDPGPGSRVERNEVVTIAVSTGEGSVTVENVIGQTESAAVRTLTRQDLSVKVRFVDVSDPIQDGRVQDQTPVGGTQAVSGSTVTIFVGRLVEEEGAVIE
jgi:serine/threonine-protein kinase